MKSTVFVGFKVISGFRYWPNVPFNGMNQFPPFHVCCIRLTEDPQLLKPFHSILLGSLEALTKHNPKCPGSMPYTRILRHAIALAGNHILISLELKLCTYMCLQPFMQPLLRKHVSANWLVYQNKY